MLTLPDLSANLEVLQFLSKYGFDGRVTVVARYEDEFEQLQAAGADAVFDSYSEAGTGFAGRVLARFPMPSPD